MELVTIKKVIEQTEFKFDIGDVVLISTDRRYNQPGVVVGIEPNNNVYQVFMFVCAKIEIFTANDIDRRLVYHIPVKDLSDIIRYEMKDGVISTTTAVEPMRIGDIQ